ncbi:hypothetical protein [Streptomyces sp. NPDC008139]|uniref:hypothetical protein n=1 Tax=Streptomyces sp. NPDC008139 TaxID=3364814 RepID=UPI0036E4B58C
MTTTPFDQDTLEPGPESDGGPPADGDAGRARLAPPPRNPPRWVRWTVVPLLVLVPIGYVLISAEQSRDSGVTKQKEAALSHLELAVPTILQRQIYQLPFPDGTTGPGYLETNSWDTSALYVQFTTTSGGLDTFLAQVGSARNVLRGGKDAITAAQARTAGWNFLTGRTYVGISMHQAGDKPDRNIVVDLTDPDVPTVYAVSTVNFRHGFKG